MSIHLPPTTYFVLLGLQDGEEGVYARTTMDVLQRDGWYWLRDGMDNGVGPFPSKAAAERAEKETPAWP